MYAFIRGLLIEATSQHAILDVQGVGYQIFIPSNLAPNLATHQETLFYVAFIVREGFQGLYGFITKQERDVFNEMIEISGVGPKLALSILSHLRLEHLNTIIMNEDHVSLSKIPGIGKKTSERLLIELRNRLEKFLLPEPSLEEKPNNQIFKDALKALVNLGFNPHHAQKALKKSLENNETAQLAELISMALKQF